MARWLSFPNIVLSARDTVALLIIALERNVAHLGEASLAERGHRVLDRRANLVRTGVIGRETELLDLGDESGIADDLCEGLPEQIEAILRRARRNHDQSAEAGNAGAPVDQARLCR